jgi:hypothetical protein
MKDEQQHAGKDDSEQIGKHQRHSGERKNIVSIL